MDDLFARARQEQVEREAPLAARMRPRTLDEFVGQEHVAGPGRLLRRAIQADQVSSLVFYGPPGTGKTTLARIIANTTHSSFVTLNAVLAGVAELRKVVAEAQEQRNLYARRTILFVDEVHRWNKAQQDALLPWVENGTIIMVGATTENPWFSVNRALLSRSRVFQLVPLDEAALRRIVEMALADSERGFGRKQVEIAPGALAHLVNVANGDARSLLNALELAVETTAPDARGVIVVDMAVAEESIQQRAVLYDREGDYHFDTISAFIKSLRGSDPDSALYWLAKMVYAGEDPRFLFRRMLISAGEDIGLADPQAVVVVEAAAAAFERVGLPEGQFHLALAALYLATTNKSNSVMGYFDALAAVREEREQPVPTHLRDASRDQEGLGHGEGYLYPHAYRDHWVAQQYLPDALQGKVFFQPSEQGYERGIRAEVERRREAQLAAMVESGPAAVEGLSYAPEQATQERWLMRAISGAARGLAEVRERLFAGLDLRRHSLVGDLNAGSGLLTWEAVRRVPEGGVWALARDAQTAQALREQAARLEALRRPCVLQGDLGALDELMAAEGAADVRWEVAFGRNALTDIPDKAAVLRRLAGRLAPGGVLRLAETVPGLGQRLYALADGRRLSPELLERWREAEEALYARADDPMVNWGPAELERALSEAGWQSDEIVPVAQELELTVSPAQVERWFAPAAPGARESYVDHLRRMLDEEAIAAVHQALAAQLVGQTVRWKSVWVFVAARRDESARKA